MKFSIIIPTFNRPQFLERAVSAILTQDYPDIEVIVQDGGTQHVKLPDDERLIHNIEHDSGITNAMNKGLKIATGDVFNWSNDDDVMLPGTLSKIHEFFTINNPSAMWCHGKIRIVNEIGEMISEMGQGCNFEDLKRINPIPQPTVFWRRAAYEKVGLMDEREDLTSDYEYWLRLALNFQPNFIDEFLANYTQHAGQITTSRLNDQLSDASRTREKYSRLERGY